MLVKIEDKWYKTQFLYFININNTITDISTVIYNSKFNVLYKGKLTDTDIVNFWTNDYEDIPYLNTHKIISDYFLIST